MTDIERKETVLKELIELLDIPDSYYEKARDRYRSLGGWFCRDDSVLKPYSPDVYPQGSFRLGTVVRPVFDCDEYDLDVVCELQASKGDVTQGFIKGLVGTEVKSYAKDKGIISPVIERKRCWRLDYADEVSFHIDVLPCIPEDETVKRLLTSLGVPMKWAEMAIALTCTSHPQHRIHTSNWPTSNPGGYGEWFEERMKQVAKKQRILLARATNESVESIPLYRLRTPLQRAIQILKRHRDVMFKNDPDLKPVSMLITTLSAQAYAGEEGLYEATHGILDRMLTHIRLTTPRVPNPVNPGEDFADKWAGNPQLELNFRKWHSEACRDLDALVTASEVKRFRDIAAKRFDWNVSEARAEKLIGEAAPRAVPNIYIPSANPPWRRSR